jgi:hypothetical protein
MGWITALICLTISGLSFLLILSLILPLSLSQDFLCRLTRTIYNSYNLNGRVAHRNQFLSCQFELFISCGKDEEQTALKWDRSCYPFATPGGHFLQFVPEIIKEILKNINGINYLQFFAVTFNGTVVNSSKVPTVLQRKFLKIELNR